jgi:hypothetical protein
MQLLNKLRMSDISMVDALLTVPSCPLGAEKYFPVKWKDRYQVPRFILHQPVQTNDEINYRHLVRQWKSLY